ncbi:MAG TPA: hypothetical protein VK518_02370, partial [Puia sp.]|nr:hypothetical protein [Puia sp.]
MASRPDRSFLPDHAVYRRKQRIWPRRILQQLPDHHTPSLLQGKRSFGLNSGGPIKVSDPGPHAPFSMATDDLAYWTGTKGLAVSRVTLGLPFYGYGFG